MSLIPGPRTFTCLGCGQNQTKTNKQKTPELSQPPTVGWDQGARGRRSEKSKINCLEGAPRHNLFQHSTCFFQIGIINKQFGELCCDFRCAERTYTNSLVIQNTEFERCFPTQLNNLGKTPYLFLKRQYKQSFKKFGNMRVHSEKFKVWRMYTWLQMS